MYNTKISIYGFHLGSYLPFHVAATSGSIAIMAFCKTWLDKDSHIGRLSKYAVLMLGTQYFVRLVYFKVVEILGIAKGPVYDICMILITAMMVWLIPVVYEIVKTRFGFLKYFNGEL